MVSRSRLNPRYGFDSNQRRSSSDARSTYARRRIRIGWPDEFTESCPARCRIDVSVEEVKGGVRLRNVVGIVPLLPGCDELTEVQISDSVRTHVEDRRAVGLPDLVADEIRAQMVGDADMEGMYSAIYELSTRGRWLWVVLLECGSCRHGGRRTRPRTAIARSVAGRAPRGARGARSGWPVGGRGAVPHPDTAVCGCVRWRMSTSRWAAEGVARPAGWPAARAWPAGPGRW
ncbi:hypothetical protein ATK86_3745 [Nocardia fluminea]|uniref:Uncharacterized protein n=1 Tax=Nocardia fluminea TaxID=134984 RepID=A0A2N3VCJ4_9NOCA|nr:hypothetical protein ATK86_3745 [Nocardia fluminea]